MALSWRATSAGNRLDRVGPQRAQVLALGRVLGELRERGRHARQDRDAELLDELPVVLDEPLVARARGRRNDDLHPVRDRQDAAAEEARDVEHRVVREDDVVFRVRHHDRVDPELVRQAAMGQPHQLGRSRGAARVHIGGDVFWLRLADEGEPVVRLLRREERKIALGDPLAARPLHREDSDVGREAVTDGRKLLPDLVAGRRPEHDHDLGARRADQLDPVRRLQHPVGAAGDAGRQRRQHDGVELRDGRQ